MLFILTGDVQIGKTTWLAGAVDALTVAGVRCDGVLAPGVWERHADGSLDKLGIDNVLLPAGERIAFARRADLARAEGTYDESAQAARAALKWHIGDDAIAAVNQHFDALKKDAASVPHASTDGHGESRDVDAPSAISAMPRSPQRVLIVDELGQLELLWGEGLTSAVRLLEAGPLGACAHACAIVRDRFGLAEAAERHFADAWGGSARISPDERAWERLVAPLLRTAGAPGARPLA